MLASGMEGGSWRVPDHRDMDRSDTGPARSKEGPRIDLGADAGESFGRWSVVDEAALFPHLTSVHLACGFHAGDPAGLRRSIGRAIEFGLAIGAHPGYPDLVGFGRRSMSVSTDELFADVLYQLGALSALLAVEGQRVHHVKAHGALYHDLHGNERLADAFGRAVVAFDPSLPVVVMAGPGGEMARGALADVGARVVTEAFPDRAYLASGALAPRSMDGASVSEPRDVAARAVALATGRPVPVLGDGEVVVQAETLCLHGDGESAVDVAMAVREALSDAGVAVRPF